MNPISNGYQSAKANAAMLGAKLVNYVETEDMATTVTNDSKQKRFENVGEYAKYLSESTAFIALTRRLRAFPLQSMFRPRFCKRRSMTPKKCNGSRRISRRCSR